MRARPLALVVLICQNTSGIAIRTNGIAIRAMGTSPSPSGTLSVSRATVFAVAPAQDGVGSNQESARRGSGNGRARGGRRARGRGRGASANARRDQLRRVCSAIRANETVVVLLAESPTGWGVGEYRAMTQAASQVNDWEMALRLIRRMEAAGKSHEADVAAYGYAVAACAKANQPDEGRMLLERLQRAGVAAEPRAYNQVMSAYARQRKWSDALALLGGMREAGVKPTVVSFNAALSACSAAGRWTEAIAQLEMMESEVDETPRPDVISYSTVISACRKASTGTMGVSAAAALELLERMQQNSARNSVAVPMANVFTFTSAILALADAGKWEDALATYRWDTCSPDHRVPLPNHATHL